MRPENANDAADADDDGRTTVLPPGAVESRNPDKSSLEISSEIRAFLAGDDGTSATTAAAAAAAATATTTTAMVGRAASYELRSFFTVWMFVSRLPSPSDVDLHPGYLMRGMCYFPVAGSLLGCMSSIVHDFLRETAGLPPPAAATLSVAFGLCLTGCFHEDGLADAADGMGGWSKSQVLKIMTDSRVGTYGCAALSLFLLLKAQLLGGMEKSRWGSSCSSGAGPAILVAQTLSRLSAPYLIRTRDYVAEVGPKSPFYLFMVEAKHIVTWPRVTFATFYCYSLSAALYGPAFAIVLILAVLVVAHLAGNEGDYLLGGVMGDFLGCTICICEIVVLTLIAARGLIVETCRAIADAFEDGGSQGYFSDPVQRMATLYDNDRIRPLANLLFLMAALKMWCKFVGPPDMYDREVKKDDTGKED